jgi:hypothetical protein
MGYTVERETLSGHWGPPWTFDTTDAGARAVGR